jgi:hypothetical protein
MSRLIEYYADDNGPSYAVKVNGVVVFDSEYLSELGLRELLEDLAVGDSIVQCNQEEFFK